MNKTSFLLVASLAMTLAICVVASSTLRLFPPSLQTAYAQQNTSSSSSNATTTAGPTIHPPDSSPEAAVITIKRDNTSNQVVFDPNNVTIRAGEEILIINNDTSPQSFTSGNGPNDPEVGAIFDTDFIQPGALIEYTSSNVQDGQQIAFFSKGDPSATGTLLISGVIP